MDQPEDYPHPVDGKIEVHETHISRVYLAGAFAYKLKKEIKTAFLDYSSLGRRHQACKDELQLGKRYAPELYLQVVPITQQGGRMVVDGNGPIVDYAVQMRRFENDSILSNRLHQGLVSSKDILEIASSTARFHQEAAKVHGDFDAFYDATLRFAIDNFDVIEAHPHPTIEKEVNFLRRWTRDEWNRTLEITRDRYQSGKVRECHGDLHCGNIVQWRGRWILFDGIEFNPDLSRIDVIYDAAFLRMDLQARGRRDLAHLWINAYIEATGDYESFKVLRWYIVYLAMVRAKVAAIREVQLENNTAERQSSIQEVERYTRMAYEFATLQTTPKLWITHGLSGSGKSTQSIGVIQSHGAIRIRSDVERLRLFGPGHYDASATQATYARLMELTQIILDAGYPVVVDATFLKRDQRTPFHQLAQSQKIPFHILDCQADIETLRARIAERLASGDDPSEADGSVLEKQIQALEPLDPEERACVVSNRPSE